MTSAEIEKRLIAVERELADLKTSPTLKAHPARALEATHGTFKNDASFKEATRLARKWRASLDAKPRRESKAKRK